MADTVFCVNGCTNHIRNGFREVDDFYATEPRAVRELLSVEKFGKKILEPCVGMGHIAQVLQEEGHEVEGHDIVDRGWPNTILSNFMEMKRIDCDVITNPPYKFATEFVQHAMLIADEGVKVAMFLKLTFLEGKIRKYLFNAFPFKTLYVCSERRNCAKNGEFEKYKSSAIAYGWYVWEKGFKGIPQIKWL